MLVPLRLRLAPGLSVAAAVPITVLLWCFTLAPLMRGSVELARTVEAAGPFAAVVALALLVELPLLSLALASTGMERRVPLAVMLSMATLPWMLGLLGTDVLAERAMAALPSGDAVEAGLARAVSTGHSMAPRLLGAWTSVALLLGLSLGLALARFDPGCLRAVGGPHRSRGLLLASGVCASLASVALVGVLEARHLFELLTGLARAPESQRLELMAAGLEVTERLRMLRWGCTGVLAVLGFTLLAWRPAGNRYSPLGWSARLVPAAAVTVLLVLDAHPVRAIERPPVAIPAGRGALPRQPSRMSTSMPRPTSTPSASTASITSPSDLRTTGGGTSSGSGLPNAS
nr:hypothetical protein [Pyxidicoccus fallax]